MRLIMMIVAGLFLAAAGGGPARAQDLARFTAMDQSAVRMYFAANPIVWMGLPSELAREFARGKPLPKGTETALPRPLLAKLPPRQGYNYVRVGDDVALIEAGTRVVMDVIENVFR
jgi:hypothetical protein